MNDTIRANIDKIKHYGVTAVFELEDTIPGDDRLIAPMMASLRATIADKRDNPVFLKLDLPKGCQRAEYIDGPEHARVVVSMGLVDGDTEDERFARVVRVDCAYVPDPEAVK